LRPAGLPGYSRSLADRRRGKRKPLNVEIRYKTSENNKAISVAIADMLKAIGVTTTFVNTDLKTHYILRRSGGDYDVARGLDR
jgi:oligopeptide transport system substrate-binding protein